MRTRSLMATVVVPLIVLLAGCGGSKSASDLYDEMRAATEAATSVRMVGSMTIDGKVTEIDLKGTRDGSNQIVTMTEADGGTATFVTVDGKEYLKADKAYFAAIGEGATGDILGDKYVVTDGPPLSADLNAGALLDGMFTEDDSFNLSTKVEDTELDGEPAFKVTDRVGSDGTELWVSAGQTAHLLKVTGPLDGSPTSLTFSEWDAVEPITAPAADEIMTF